MKLKFIMFTKNIFFIFIFLYLIYFFIFNIQYIQINFFNDQCDSYLLALSSSIIKPLKKFTNLSDKNISHFLKTELGNKGGVYSILNTDSSFQYIGSNLNLHSRLMDHIKGRDSNIRLQRAINKIGLSKFNILIYYFHTDSAVLLTDIETSIIASFPFDSLYNFKKEANSMLGYKHTKKAIEKIKLRYLNKNNHPMFGKKHTDLSLSLITKPDKLNPMFGKKHRLSTIKLMSLKKSIRPIGLYDLNHNLIEKFINQIELANKFNICKSTVSRYIKSGNIFKEKYFIKEIYK